MCVQDNGEGAGAETGDRFYLSCTAGCGGGYDTGSDAADDGIDGENVQVRQEAQTAAAERPGLTSEQSAAAEPAPATLILDPLLLTDGAVGQVQVFTVTVYRDQELLANAAVTLKRERADGFVETPTGVTGVSGTVVFTAVNLASRTEYIATAGRAESNAIEVAPLV